jgi:hypothetical protein
LDAFGVAGGLALGSDKMLDAACNVIGKTVMTVAVNACAQKDA